MRRLARLVCLVVGGVLPAMGQGYGFLLRYTDLLEDALVFRASLCLPAPAPAEAPYADDPIFDKLLRHDPCGRATLLPGESIRLLDLESLDCGHPKGAHESGSYQIVWDYHFLIRLVDTAGRTHTFLYRTHYYAGAPSTLTGCTLQFIFEYRDPFSGMEWGLMVRDSDTANFSNLKLFWDGETLYWAREIDFEEEAFWDIPCAFGSLRESTHLQERDKDCPTTYQSVLYRLWRAPPRTEPPCPIRAWEAILNDTLRQEHIAYEPIRPRCAWEPSKSMYRIVGPDDVTDGRIYFGRFCASVPMPHPIDVPAGRTFRPDFNGRSYSTEAMWYLLRKDGTLAAIVVTGFPDGDEVALFTPQWKLQKVLGGEDYHEGKARFHWDGETLRLFERITIREGNLEYKDFPLSVVLKAFEDGWDMAAEPYKRDWLLKPPALADVLPPALERRIIVEERCDFTLPAYDYYDTFWHYEILLDGKPRDLYILPNRACIIPAGPAIDPYPTQINLTSREKRILR